MTLRQPLWTLPAVLMLGVLGHLLMLAAAHAAWEVGVPLEGLTAGGQVALERLLHGDLSGAMEAFVAIFRG